jgi:hypothetical protein
MRYVLITLISFSLFACKKKGCTDPKALNYNPDVKNDYGLCNYPQNFRVTKVRVEFDTTWINSWTTQNSLDTYIKINDEVLLSGDDGPIAPVYTDTIFNNSTNFHEETVTGFEGPIIFDAPLWYHDRITVSLSNFDTNGSDGICSHSFTHFHIYHDNKYPQYLQAEEQGLYKMTVWLDYY